MKKSCLSALLATALVLGCDSKSIEKSPDAVSIRGLSLDERIADKARIDDILSRVESSSKKIKTVITLIKKFKQQADGIESLRNYTQVDLLLDISEQLRSEMPENREGQLVRFGKIKLPLPDLSEECQTLDTSLVSQAVYDDGSLQKGAIDESKKAVGQQVVFSFKVCGSSDFLPAATIDYQKNEMSFILHKNNFELLLQKTNLDYVLDKERMQAKVDELLNKKLNDLGKCSLTIGDNMIVDSVGCKDLVVDISNNETVFVKEALFDMDSDIRFSAQAEILNMGAPKATLDISILRDGTIDKLDLVKVNPPATVNN